VVGSSVVGSSVAVQRALIEAFIAALVALSRRWPRRRRLEVRDENTSSQKGAWVQASSCRPVQASSSGSIPSLRRRDAGQPAADAGYNGMAATPGARPAVRRGPPAAVGHESYRVCPLFIESITPERWDACIVHAASIHESHDASSWAPDASTCSYHGRLADAPLGGAGAARAGGAGGAERVVGLRPPQRFCDDRHHLSAARQKGENTAPRRSLGPPRWSPPAVPQALSGHCRRAQWWWRDSSVSGDCRLGRMGRAACRGRE
jgi:hypothetical protein